MKPIRIMVVTDANNISSLKYVSHFPEMIVTLFLKHPQQLKTSNIDWQCDIAIIDMPLTMIDMSDTINVLKQQHKDMEIIVICPQIDSHQARILINMGVKGILLKQELADNFIQYVQTVHAGKVVISPTILKELLAS